MREQKLLDILNSARGLIVSAHIEAKATFGKHDSKTLLIVSAYLAVENAIRAIDGRDVELQLKALLRKQV